MIRFLTLLHFQAICFILTKKYFFIASSNAHEIPSAFVSKISDNKRMNAQKFQSMTNLNEDGCSVGFIGCGTIASAIIKGFARQEQRKIRSIVVTKRNELKSKEVSDLFPKLVTVCDENQEILDQADIIFVCVLPKQLPTVLSDLVFDPNRHTLVSLVVSDRLSHDRHRT